MNFVTKSKSKKRIIVLRLRVELFFMSVVDSKCPPGVTAILLIRRIEYVYIN